MPKPKKLKGNGKIRYGGVKLDVPHKGEIITFVFSIIDLAPFHHQMAMDIIDRSNLLRPTTAQTFSLLDLVFQNPKESHCKKILRRFKEYNRHLWTSTESLYFPGGVLVYDNIDGKMPSTREELLKRLDEGLVRFVKPGFKEGQMPISEFLKNPYVIAQVGEDMLETVERVAKQCQEKEAYLGEKEAYVSIEDRVSEDIKRPGGLVPCKYNGGPLTIGGGIFCDIGFGHAFGVEKKLSHQL